MLHILNAKILADEREQDIRRQLRERASRREAEVANAESSALQASADRTSRGDDRLCPDCPARVPATAR